MQPGSKLIPGRNQYSKKYNTSKGTQVPKEPTTGGAILAEGLEIRIKEKQEELLCYSYTWWLIFFIRKVVLRTKFRVRRHGWSPDALNYVQENNEWVGSLHPSFRTRVFIFRTVNRSSIEDTDTTCFQKNWVLKFFFLIWAIKCLWGITLLHEAHTIFCLENQLVAMEASKYSSVTSKFCGPKHFSECKLMVS